MKITASPVNVNITKDFRNRFFCSFLLFDSMTATFAIWQAEVSGFVFYCLMHPFRHTFENRYLKNQRRTALLILQKTFKKSPFFKVRTAATFAILETEVSGFAFYCLTNPFRLTFENRCHLLKRALSKN